MGPNRFSSCMNWRIISICIGVLTTISWILIAYQMAVSLFPIHVLQYHSGYYAVSYTPPVSAFICFLTSIAISALMVFGAIKRIANYILPWLAIHFVVTMFSIAMAFSHVIFLMLVEDQQYVIKAMAVATLVTVALIFSWGGVYLYWKSLVTPIRVASTDP